MLVTDDPERDWPPVRDAERYRMRVYSRFSEEAGRGGKALFTLRMFNPNIDALAHMFRSDNCFPSLGDSGAHVSQVMDAGWATFMLCAPISWARLAR